MIQVVPIGVVRTAVAGDKEDEWGSVVSTIELDSARFTAEALTGLDAFSHIEVIFVFDRVPERAIEKVARHPRERTDWPKVGIFAQRAKSRPNRIGLSCCRLIVTEGLTITVQGLDAFDGTPVLDIKPYFPEFGPRGPVRVPAWSGELMGEYFS
jgi:tRNA-Thr(GGU) m(6)t(6)A37 methyltransferase TsaA